MPIYRKDEQGLVYKTAGNAVQRWNDKLFLTEHTYDDVENKDYYDIEALANKYIMGLTDYTEFQLYFTEANQTQNVYIRFGGKSLRVTRSDGDPLGVAYLKDRASFYTKQASIDNAIWIDRLLQPPLDTYRGGFTYAVLTWDQDSIPQPNVGDTAIALDTNVSYEWDEGNQEWDLTGELSQPSNGWYWQIDFFPDYNFGNGKIMWDGGSEDWSIYTARVPLPDEETIVTDAITRKMKVAIKPAASIVPDDGSINEFASTQAVIDYAQRKIEFTDSDEVEPVYDKDVVIIVDSTDEVIKKIKTKIGDVVNTYELPKGFSGDFEDLTNVPEDFTPSEHEHDYVPVEEGKDLVAITEIERLALVDNYDDTTIQQAIADIQNIIAVIDGVDDTPDTVINKLHEIVALLNGYAEGTTLADLLSGKANTAHNHDSEYYKKSETYTKTQTDALVGNLTGNTQELKSITTQPTGTFVYGDLYYNSSTKGLYYYTGSAWELTGVGEPIAGVIYSFNGTLYFWNETEVDLIQIGGGVDLSNYYTKTEIDAKFDNLLGGEY